MKVLRETAFGCLLVDRLARTVCPLAIPTVSLAKVSPLENRCASFIKRPSRFALLLQTYEALALRTRLVGLHVTSYAYSCAGTLALVQSGTGSRTVGSRTGAGSRTGQVVG